MPTAVCAGVCDRESSESQPLSRHNKRKIIHLRFLYARSSVARNKREIRIRLNRPRRNLRISAACIYVPQRWPERCGNCPAYSRGRLCQKRLQGSKSWVRPLALGCVLSIVCHLFVAHRRGGKHPGDTSFLHPMDFLGGTGVECFDRVASTPHFFREVVKALRKRNQRYLSLHVYKYCFQ